MPRKNQKNKLSKSALKQQKLFGKKTEEKATSGQNVKDNLILENLDKTGLANVKDIHVPNFTMNRPGGGSDLLMTTDLQLTYGRKYGLIGKNGYGKTTLLDHIANNKIPEIPNHLRILHIKQEMPASDRTVYDTVVNSNRELNVLLQKEQQLSEVLTKENEGRDNKSRGNTEQDLQKISDRLETLDITSAPARAAVILAGLQFDEEMQNLPTKSLSGGWRMRVSLACALFAEPDLLLLDEPTNHLDFPAVEWLSSYIKEMEKTLVVVSHDRKFLNDVCTDIIHIEGQKLKYYKGNYDTFEKVRKEQRKQAKTAYDKQQATIEHNQDFIRRFRANKKLASLAQSRIKIIAGMEKLEDVKEERKFRFHFPEPKTLKKDEVILIDEMTFGYNPQNILYKNVNLRVTLGGVIGVFGKNGSGKSTLINLIRQKEKPLQGEVSLNSNAVIGYFAQHHSEMLDVESTPYELLMRMFPKTKHQDVYRKLGQFKLAENCANKKIKLMSGGEKSRLSFAILTWHEPNLLIMDEPTNHLDIETIDGLIKAIKSFEGAVILISHDEHFLSSVCNEFWAIGPDKNIRAFHRFKEGKDYSYQ